MTISTTNRQARAKRPRTNPAMAAIIRILGELTDELRRSLDFYLKSENLKRRSYWQDQEAGLDNLMSFSNNG